jgi:hypothetical protein
VSEGAPLVYVDVSDVRDGALEELKDAFARLVEFVRTNVPEALFYGVYLSEDGRRVTVVHGHPDSRSLEQHLEVGAEAFRSFAGLLDLTSIRVYGEPSGKTLDLIAGKARALGCDDVAVHGPHAGFGRFGGIGR